MSVQQQKVKEFDPHLPLYELSAIGCPFELTCALRPGSPGFYVKGFNEIFSTTRTLSLRHKILGITEGVVTQSIMLQMVLSETMDFSAKRKCCLVVYTGLAWLPEEQGRRRLKVELDSFWSFPVRAVQGYHVRITMDFSAKRKCCLVVFTQGQRGYLKNRGGAGKKQVEWNGFWSFLVRAVQGYR